MILLMMRLWSDYQSNDEIFKVELFIFC